jgi:hypothetical protein
LDSASKKIIRRAVLVIHGIGQQRRYQILSEFALGLLRNGLPEPYRESGNEYVKELKEQFAQAGLELFEHGPINVGNNLKVGIEVFKSARDFDSRIELTVPPSNSCPQEVKVDIYESYWAQIVDGHTNVLRVIWWLLLTTFRSAANVFTSRDPLQKHPDSDEKRRGETDTSKPEDPPRQDNPIQTAWDFIKELFRFLFILALIMGIVYGLYSSVCGLINSYLMHKDEFKSVIQPLTFILIILSFFYVFIALQFVIRWLTGGISQPWYLKVGMLALFIVSGFLIYWDIKEFYPVVRWLIFAFLLIVGSHKIFVEYLGDVEIYISGNDFGKNCKIRSDIITKTMQKLETILDRKAPRDMPNHRERPYYDEVIVIGHSLGSVIAYDVLCRLLRGDGSNKSRNVRKRLKHLFTVGSPLDKIWYFFRDRSEADNPIYQGILVQLKGVKASGITQSPLSDITWTNIWTYTDIVSGKLEEYGDQVVNIHLPRMLWPPFVNHVMYWGSGDVMGEVGERAFPSTYP